MRDFFRETIVRKFSARNDTPETYFSTGRSWETILQSSPASFRKTFGKIVLWKSKSSSRNTSEGFFLGNYCSKVFRQKPCSENLLFDRKIVRDLFSKFSREFPENVRNLFSKFYHEFSENFRTNCSPEKQIEFSEN